MHSMAIACGGTGGHLFPGLAVADELRARGCSVTLLISPKEVDQQAVRNATGVEVVTLPAVALTGRSQIAFLRGFWKSIQASRALFAKQKPCAVLAMGGFTSAPPVLAGKRAGARAFLHESNSIPGRANRWLSWTVDRAFVGFPQAGARLHTRNVTITGTPVRAQFRPRDAAQCRTALGLDPQRPVVLVMGGSQGASGINDLMLQATPLLIRQLPEVQFFHLTGVRDFERVRSQATSLGGAAVFHAFFEAMEIALGAATVAVSRAGASSLAELAALRVPAVLVPFPAAADNHQFHNARAFEQTGAARLIEQRSATPESLAKMILELLGSPDSRTQMSAALSRWDAPHAAQQIAEAMLEAVEVPRSAGERQPRTAAPPVRRHQSALT